VIILFPTLIELVSRDKDYYYKTNGGVTLSGGDPLLQDPDSLIPLLESIKEKRTFMWPLKLPFTYPGEISKI